MVLERYFTAKTRLKATQPALRSMRNRAKGQVGDAVLSCLESVGQLREVFRCAVCGSSESDSQSLIDVVKVETEGGIVFDFIEVPESQHQRLLSYDGVLVALDAVDPWDSAMWGFLTALPVELHSKLLLVVQRCDLRTDGELATVLQHMGNETHRRLGRRSAPVRFSAKLAKMSAADCANPDQLRDQSGIDELIEALDAVLFDATGCLEAIRLAAASGQKVLEALRGDLGDVADELDETEAVCQEIEQLAENVLEQVAERVSPVLAKVDSEIMDVAATTEEQLVADQRGDVDERATTLQNQLMGELTDATKRALVNAAKRMEEQLSKGWAHIGRHLHDHYSGAFRPKDLKEVSWKKHRRQFLEAGKARLKPEVDSFDIREPILAELARPVRARRLLFAAIVLLVAISLGVGLWLNQWLIAGACFAAVLIPVVIHLRWTKRWQKSSARIYWDALNAHRARIEKAMVATLKEDTKIYANEFKERVKQLADRAQSSRDKKEPVLSDFSEFEKTIADVRLLLNGGS